MNWKQNETNSVHESSEFLSSKCTKENMSFVHSSSFEMNQLLLFLHGNQINLLQRRDHRRQYINGTLSAMASIASRNNNINNVITHRHRMRQLYSPICEHERRHCHEIANHYKDWCRRKIDRRAKRRTKRVLGARTNDSCLVRRETLQIPRFDYPR